jgi:hypothetical protein
LKLLVKNNVSITNTDVTPQLNNLWTLLNNGLNSAQYQQLTTYLLSNNLQTCLCAELDSLALNKHNQNQLSTSDFSQGNPIIARLPEIKISHSNANYISNISQPITIKVEEINELKTMQNILMQYKIEVLMWIKQYNPEQKGKRKMTVCYDIHEQLDRIKNAIATLLKQGALVKTPEDFAKIKNKFALIKKDYLGIIATIHARAKQNKDQTVFNLDSTEGQPNANNDLFFAYPTQVPQEICDFFAKKAAHYLIELNLNDNAPAESVTDQLIADYSNCFKLDILIPNRGEKGLIYDWLDESIKYYYPEAINEALPHNFANGLPYRLLLLIGNKILTETKLELERRGIQLSNPIVNSLPDARKLKKLPEIIATLKIVGFPSETAEQTRPQYVDSYNQYIIKNKTYR